MSVDARLPIAAWGRLSPGQPVHLYLEGDGHAWRSSGRPSSDPTPQDPVALRLAATDPHASVLYLGRPCQYVNAAARGCHFSVWTTRRFAEIDDMAVALHQLVGEGRDIILIGFSGGANIAVQLAERLPDVKGLVTVAGNLDTDSFTRFHRLADEAYGHNSAILQKLSGLPQLHYTGSQDVVVPPELTRRQLKEVAGQSECVRIEEVKSARHHGPWRLDWSVFAELQRRCGT
ncbi:pimeloyl-ACP methyl ester carboxylesterase [Oceanisphaera litoralis]|uniref:hypothetical protein n=1 Tax=Oceanisphaera litoralis TaxID=225144 RepID=UPI0019580E7B|nr:hypothetical protein [Oceanisphaera litoralis]MBM7456944.1 pimeloyl-ACP methyl ester carboxylesterase [Oceanisphaera litoralis]